MIIGVTGGICSGKSSVAKMIEGAGFHRVDADSIAHRLLRRGKGGWRRVVEAFGKGVLDEEGEIRRKILGEMVFSDPKKRALLEEILHPMIERELREELAKGEKVVLDAPLLIEKGFHQLVDVLIVVYATEELQVARMAARDGIGPEEAKRRIEAQMPLLEKVSYADYIVNNCADLPYTQEQVKRILKEIQKGGIG